MLQTYVIPTLQQRVCLQETISMHDGAPPHNVSSVQQLLRQELTDVRVNCRSFQKQLATTITRSHALRILVIGLFER
ncbi:hypothetical protein TNCV_4991171 [Trichonephila clavipes]|nr:hypothetical protein TNCV_4991171 [Trichonephila clavipes]